MKYRMGFQRFKSEYMPFHRNCLEVKLVYKLPRIEHSLGMTLLMKFECILKSCTRIGTGNNIALITSIPVVPESDS